MKNRKLRYINQSDGTRAVFDGGHCIGKLMPTVIQHGPGVQSWSRPGNDSGHNVTLFDGGSSIANFSDYFGKVHAKTYPLPDVSMANFLRAANKAVTEYHPEKCKVVPFRPVTPRQSKTDGNPSRFINLVGE